MHACIHACKKFENEFVAKRLDTRVYVTRHADTNLGVWTYCRL